MSNYTTVEQTKKGLRAAQSSIGVVRAEIETLAGRVGVNENAIDVLNGTGAGSVSKSISDAIDAVVDGAPDTFDTLKELADWIADDQTGAAAMAADIANKVDKVEGKGLSANDYTETDKTKLTGLANIKTVGKGLSLDANGNLVATGGGVADAVAWENVTDKPTFATVATSGDYSDLTGTPELATVATTGAYSDLTGTPIIPTVPTNVSAFANDAGYVTSADITTAIDGKVDKVEGKGLSTEDYTTEEKTKLAELSNYDDTALAGRVTAAETALTGKANTADLATVATSGSYNDLTDKPAAYELPTASDTTLGGIKVNSTSGATVEDGVLKVTQQSGTGGGAIPAYIVGDTMTSGWLSETENGTALTPVDKQEYVIMTSGEWLRKHVMWVADLGVYRLTGKVETADELVRKIVLNTTTKTQTLAGDKSGEYNNTYTLNNITLDDNGELRIQFDYSIQKDSRIDIRVGDTVLETLSTNANDYSGSYDKTFTVTSEYNGLHPITRGYHAGSTALYTNARQFNITATYNREDRFYDYETDDVIDITESEIETIWGETAGAADPTNNVFSTEERLWGYWIDEKPIYRKTVSCGALPNNVLKSVPHGITNIDKTISMAGFAMQKKGSNKYSIPIPFTSGNGGKGVEAMLQVNDVDIRIKTNGDLSSYNESYVTLYYTKTA